MLIALLIPSLAAIFTFRRLAQALWLQVIRGPGRHGQFIALAEDPHRFWARVGGQLFTLVIAVAIIVLILRHWRSRQASKD
ncbi:hypothetical protein [Caulobacter sp.]|uniref:hypothetical protein n=1 Tax=Caulobacter sp. TaxID=78 RepID=UPI0025BBF0E5|nr:hypothetical protein [Caulobacter sp.]